MERYILGEVEKQTVPFGIQIRRRQAGLLENFQTLATKMSVGLKFRRGDSENAASLVPSFILEEPLDQGVPAPGIPRGRAQEESHLSARLPFVAFSTTDPSGATQGGRRIGEPFPNLKHNFIGFVVSALLDKKSGEPIGSEE